MIRSRPSEKPHAGTSCSQKHADEIIVTSTATQTARKIFYIYLHDGAGVVRQPARQARIDLNLRANTFRVGKLDNRTQFIHASGAQFVVANKLNQTPQYRSIQSLSFLCRSLLRPQSLPHDRAPMSASKKSSKLAPAAGSTPRSLKLFFDPRPANLIQLIERDQRHFMLVMRDARRLQHASQSMAMIYPDREVVETKLR